MNTLGWFAFGLFYILFPLAVLAYALRGALRGRGSPHRVQRQMLDALRPLSPGADPGEVRQLQQTWVELSQRAMQTREPVRRWGVTLQATSQALDQLLTLSSYRELLDNPSLRIGSYFNGRLNRYIHQVRAALQERDPAATTRSLGQLQGQVEGWRDLTANWSALRDIARASISTAVQERDFVELRHASQVRLHASDAPANLTWNAWAAVHTNPAILKPLADWLANALPERGWRFSVVCALSATGIPLATLLSVGLQRTLLAMDSETRHFMPRQPRRGERLLLVDATVQTGRHLQGAEEQALAAGGSVCGAVVIAMNDMLPPGAKPEEVARWLDADRLIYFYRLSDLYRHWWEGQRTAQR